MHINVRRLVILVAALPLVAAGSALLASNDVPQSSLGELQVAATPGTRTALTLADDATVNVAQAGKVQHEYHFLHVSAILTSGGGPVVGQTVTFTTDTSMSGVGVICTDTTDNTGKASCADDTKVDSGEFSGDPTQAIATFDGTAVLQSATATVPLRTVG
jgi:hypothetical protein